MHEGTIANGPIGNWLAIIGVISLIYWGWRICAAILGRSPGKESAAAVPAPAAAGGDAPLAAVAAPENDIVVIAAAVYAELGAHRIVHLEEESQAAGLGCRRPLDATDFPHDPPLIAQHRTRKMRPRTFLDHPIFAARTASLWNEFLSRPRAVPAASTNEETQHA